MKQNRKNKIGKIVFIIIFLSLIQIQITSAESPFCCKEDNNCLTILSQDIYSAEDNCNGEVIVSGRCEDYGQGDCEWGCCVYNNGEECSSNSYKIACENLKGTFVSSLDGSCSSISSCNKGCCEEAYHMMTESNCLLWGDERGIETTWNPVLNEFECVNLLEQSSSNEGACIIENQYSENDCKRTTKAGCDSLFGHFYQGLLCTNTQLETNCESTGETTCVSGKEGVYYIDSCGNIANIYDADKRNNKDYWNRIYSRSESCNSDESNADSSSCGNCKLELGSICEDDSQTKTDFGDYICKDLNCHNAPSLINSLGEVLETQDRTNGESWCLYDSSIGIEESPYGNDISTDTIGSLHWLATCSLGEVVYDLCGDYRNGICTQSITQTNEGEEISIASCEENPAIKCINYNGGDNIEDKCDSNPYCKYIKVKASSGTEFDYCVPKYPLGFEQNPSGSVAERQNDICDIGNIKCIEVWYKNKKGEWECENNCDCKSPTFSKNTNDFCVSLGDCGSYVNYLGKGTDNIGVAGTTENADAEDYKEFANAKSGKYILNLLLDIYMAYSISQLDGGLDSISIIPDHEDLYSTNIGEGIGEWWDEFYGFYLEGGMRDLNKQYFPTSGKEVLETAKDFDSQKDFVNEVIYRSMVGTNPIAGHLASEAFGIGDAKLKIRSFSCSTWQAPTGEQDCSVCNNDLLGRPCTKYKCESIGKNCKLINADRSDNASCQMIPLENVAPEIKIENVFNSNLKLQTTGLSDNVNAKIISKQSDEGGENCINSFEKIQLNLQTDEYAQCKYSFALPVSNDFEDMQGYDAGNNYYIIDHNMSVRATQVEYKNEEINIISKMNEDTRRSYYYMRMFIRCSDYNGNYNLDPYKVDFCLYEDDESPVNANYVEFNPKDETYLAYGKNTSNVEMWLPEPAECRYSNKSNKDYSEMKNNMTCDFIYNLTSIWDTRGFKCEAILNNLEENKFYFKCNDSVGNLNTENIPLQGYSLKITKEPLEIMEINYKAIVNGETYTFDKEESTSIGGFLTQGIDIEMEVLTKGGAGEIFCKWNNKSTLFLKNIGHTHRQILSNRFEGNYSDTIECSDSAGNAIEEITSFKLELDTSPPGISRIYKSGGSLKLQTSEYADCYVNNESVCNFNINSNSVEKMSKSSNGLVHSISWIPGKEYYIKCFDKWDNPPTKCSVIIHAEDDL